MLFSPRNVLVSFYLVSTLSFTTPFTGICLNKRRESYNYIPTPFFRYATSLNSAATKVSIFNDYLCQIMSSNQNSVILIDGDNVRGKTKFALSKEDLCQKVELWKISSSINASIIVFFDHASEHAAFYKQSSGIGITFSGPILKVDDVIARDVPYFQERLNSSLVAVVTEDVELKKRCRKGSVASAASKRKFKTLMKLDMIKKKDVEENSFQYLSYDLKDRKVMTVDSTKFADLLYLLDTPIVVNSDSSTNTDSESIDNAATPVSTSQQYLQPPVEIQQYRKQLENMIQTESKLQYELQKLQNIVYRQRASASSKRKRVHDNVHQKIAAIQLKIDEIVNSSNSYFHNLSATLNITSTTTTASVDGTQPANQQQVWSELNSIQYNATKDFIERGSDLILNYFNRTPAGTTAGTGSGSSNSNSGINMKGVNKLGKMEETWERVILAERMRRILLTSSDALLLQSPPSLAKQQSSLLEKKVSPQAFSSLSSVSILEVFDTAIDKTTEVDIINSLLVEDHSKDALVQKYVRGINDKVYRFISK